MKKLSIVIISLALVLGLSQCKKKVTEITPAATPEVNGNLVHIRVNAGHGDKHVVYPESGAYVFENGDKLYVGNHGYYVGTWNIITVLSAATSKSPIHVQLLTRIICTSISLAVHILANCTRRRRQIQQDRLNGASLTKRVVSFLLFHTVIPHKNTQKKQLPIHVCLKTSAAW